MGVGWDGGGVGKEMGVVTWVRCRGEGKRDRRGGGEM